MLADRVVTGGLTHKPVFEFSRRLAGDFDKGFAKSADVFIANFNRNAFKRQAAAFDEFAGFLNPQALEVLGGFQAGGADESSQKSAFSQVHGASQFSHHHRLAEFTL